MPHQWPACPGKHPVCLSRPYPLQGGFWTLLSSETKDSCHVTQAGWSLDSAITDGPHSFSGIYPSELWISMAPIGEMDNQGRVAIANLKVMDEGGPITGDETIVFQIDRYANGGFHEVVLPPIEYPWGDQYPLTGSDGWHLFSQTVSYGGLFTALYTGHDQVGPPRRYFAVIMAQGNEGGEVTITPRILYSPPEKEGFIPGSGANAFAQNADEFAMVSTVRYYAEGNVEDCITARYSVVYDIDGNVVDGPNEIMSHPVCEDFDLEEEQNRPGLVWSGTHYGYCDRFQYDTTQRYEFRRLDEDGEQVGGPISLSWDLSNISEPPGNAFHHFCDITAIDENAFAIVAYMPETDEHPRGIYITYVKFGPVV
jgi:hypothetical protein